MDIRTWNKNGTRPGKGVTLTEKEVNDLIQTYLIWKAENKSIVKASCEKVSATNKYILHKVLLVMDRVYEGMKTELTVITWSGQNTTYDLRPWKKNHVKYDHG